MLTYAFPHVTHFLADWESRLLCVCLWRDRLDDVAYCFPHSVHVYRGRFSVAAAEAMPGRVDTPVELTDFLLERPSLIKNASYVYATVFPVGWFPSLNIGATACFWSLCCWLGSDWTVALAVVDALRSRIACAAERSSSAGRRICAGSRGLTGLSSKEYGR
jgi:hypothetical protein